MKQLLWILMFVLLTTSVLAIDADIKNVNPVCDNSGNLGLSALESGKALSTSGITVSATYNVTGESFILTGNWQADGQNVTLLIPPGIDQSEVVSFASVNGPLTKNGAYVGTVSFYQASSDFYPTNISFIFSCPGKACQADSQCNSDEFCNKVTDTCNYLNCNSRCETPEFNRCVPKCKSSNPCTRASCDNETGSCNFEQINNCCQTDTDCNDNLACTNDRCVNGKCEYTPVQCVGAKGSCVIGSCVEPTGCVYTTNQSCLGGLSEKRDYMIVVGEPRVVRTPLITQILQWISEVFGGIAKSFF